MATILSVTDIVEMGRVSTYLSANYVSKGALFGGTVIKPTPPAQIAWVTDALDWGNSGGAQTEQSLRQTANYAYWLYGKFGLEAQFIIDGDGGGSVTPTPSGGTLPYALDWEVGATSSSSAPLADGESTVVISQFIGYNIEFTRNGVGQNTTIVSGNSYFIWDRATGTFTVSPAVALTELLRITPSR